MNIITHLQLGDVSVGRFPSEYLVTEVHTHFDREYNAFHPSAKPGCTSIDISLVAPLKKDLTFQEWYVGNTVKSGRIRFELMDIGAKGESVSDRFLYFFDAQCYYMGERYDIRDKSLRILDLKLKVAGCVIDDVIFCEDTEEMNERNIAQMIRGPHGPHGSHGPNAPFAANDDSF